MKTKICYIISEIDKALAFEWVAEYLDKNRFELFFILLNPSHSVLEVFLKEHKIPVYTIQYNGKKDLPRAVFSIYRFLKKQEIKVVHCHLFVANLAGLAAARLAGICRRIYTRHHSTLHHIYFPRAVWYDKLINYLATDIVAISTNVQNVLVERENVPVRKIHLIPHGFDLAKFSEKNSEKIRQLQHKYGTSGKFPVIGVIARYVDWKGIQYLIPAFAKVLEQYPHAHLVLANAIGDFKPAIQVLLQKLPKTTYTEIAFEQDLFQLYHLFDVFVHIPVNPEIEAFGQTYVEALAAGIPSVFTLSGIAPEFVRHQENAWVVPFEDTQAVETALLTLLTDKTLAEKLSQNGKQSVRQRFSLNDFIQKLEELYDV